MGRTPCCAKVGINRGAWTALEDKILTDYIEIHGEGKWKQLPKIAGSLVNLYTRWKVLPDFIENVYDDFDVICKFEGLKRCGKSCRLRWLNYLRPDIKRGNISEDEEDLIVRLHKLLGNRWSLIAGRIPGRTDNEIKNYWNTNLSKKVASPSLSPVTTNLNTSFKNTEPKHAATTSNAMNIMNSTTIGHNSSPRVFRTKATRCTKAVEQPPPPSSTSNAIASYGHDEGLAENPLDNFNNNLSLEEDLNAEFTKLLDDNFDDLHLGDFCLSDFLNNDTFDNQSINNTDNEKDCDLLETVNWPVGGHAYRSDARNKANVGSDGNPQPQQCPWFIDMYDSNNWDL